MSDSLRTALVTGGSRGIGATICRRLACDGISIAVNYRERRAEAEAVAAAIRAAGGKALAVEADITDGWQVASMMKMLSGELGPIDVLVNNAGVYERGDLSEYQHAALERMRRTNVDALITVTQEAVEGMKARRWGRIVNLTSVAAHGTALPGTTFYAATKAEVAILTRRWAMDLGPYGITVNAVAPGYIVTEMATTGRDPEELDKHLADMAARAMVRRTGTPEDVAAAVAFLVSEEAGFITAQTITVDGGRMDYIA